MIDTKAKFIELWQRGVFGNKLRSWSTIKAWSDSGYNGLTNIRSRRSSNPSTLYGIRHAQMVRAMQELMFNNIMTLEEMYFVEAAPDDCLTIQGEYHNGYLMYSRERVVMKKVCSWEHTEGTKAHLLLQEAMSPDSYDDFRTLLDLYPNHVIEFSCYEQLLGSCPGRNTIIWEVRAY